MLRDHSRPTAGAWYGNGWASVSVRPTERRGWGRSRESVAVISWPGVSGFPLRVSVAFPGAVPPRCRTARNKVPHDDVHRLPRSSQATPLGSVAHIPAHRRRNGPVAVDRLQPTHLTRDINPHLTFSVRFLSSPQKHPLYANPWKQWRLARGKEVGRDVKK